MGISLGDGEPLDPSNNYSHPTPLIVYISCKGCIFLGHKYQKRTWYKYLQKDLEYGVSNSHIKENHDSEHPHISKKLGTGGKLSRKNPSFINHSHLNTPELRRQTLSS